MVEAMVMQIGAAVGCNLTRDDETECLRMQYAAEQAETLARRKRAGQLPGLEPGRVREGGRPR
jgi:hypothetical protein